MYVVCEWTNRRLTTNPSSLAAGIANKGIKISTDPVGDRNKLIKRPIMPSDAKRPAHSRSKIISMLPSRIPPPPMHSTLTAHLCLSFFRGTRPAIHPVAFQFLRVWRSPLCIGPARLDGRV